MIADEPRQPLRTNGESICFYLNARLLLDGLGLLLECDEPAARDPEFDHRDLGPIFGAGFLRRRDQPEEIRRPGRDIPKCPRLHGEGELLEHEAGEQSKGRLMPQANQGRSYPRDHRRTLRDDRIGSENQATGPAAHHRTGPPSGLIPSQPGLGLGRRLGNTRRYAGRKAILAILASVRAVTRQSRKSRS